MAQIEFTQYCLPDGRQKTVHIRRPDAIVAKAEAIKALGYRFECEMLTTNEISLTISDEDGDADIEICANGPDVPLAVDRLITRFAA